MHVFLLILFALAAVVIGLLGTRLTGIGSYSWAIAIVSVLAVMIFPILVLIPQPEFIDTNGRRFVHFFMGFLSFTIGLVVIRDLIFVPASYFNPNLANHAYSGGVTLSILAVSVLIFFYGYWNATRDPAIYDIQIPIANLPKELSDFSLVQISDLHAGPSVSREFVDRVVEIATNLKPTAFVMTGDIADGKAAIYSPSIASFARLSAAGPVYYVTGNHEYLHDSDNWVERFNELGFKVLPNAHVIYQHRGRQVLIAGITDPQARAMDPSFGPDISKALADAPKADLKILLAHQPKIADEAAGYFDLQVSGHTHGGQFFPWNLIIGLFQKYDKGLMKAKNMWVYVNQGTGYWGPPLRVGTRGEITLIRFTGK